MARKVIFIGLAIVLVLTPIVLLLFRMPTVATMMPQLLHIPVKSQVSSKYSAQSMLPGYQLILINSSYLDYVTSNAGVFGQNAIVDPSVYHKNSLPPNRYTVSSIRFVLQSAQPDTPISIITGDGVTMPGGIVSEAGYIVENNTLVVQVWLNVKSLTSGIWIQKVTMEDAFIRAALNALYYARGLTTIGAEHDTLVKANQDVQQNLDSGLFPWPFQIVATK
ncbi:MAG: hypothetical protein M1282_13995 [Chloroflexi bacterium]|nr:hypothetical protein [Chloroflexota bacterium]